MTTIAKISVLSASLALIFLGKAFAQAPARAYAELKDADGKSIGMAIFREVPGGVLLNLEAKGLSSGLHAIHIHAVGQCVGPGFTSAGGHFNPTQKKHGLKNPEGPHAGDLPNLYVTKEGISRYAVLADGFTLKAGGNALLDSDGSALVIHASVDDYSTDPTGNAGDRSACGVVTAGQPKKK
ncbi:MAG: superoxide dismutase family protein [Deltaproteobacteria bacterium]|nr:superoxide dismutase family protein [Deltaproteobacteria bacterium]